MVLMEKIKHFFWLCSGAHVATLRQCPGEGSKYAGIGATIFFTGLFAALAGAYAFHTVFDQWIVSILLGICWGLMIFNLDRYIVSSMRKEKTPQREWLTALPRIVLAVLISLVIAKPLEMRIFDKEIQSELVIMEQQTYTAQESEIRQRYNPTHQRLSREVAAVKAEVIEKEQERNDLDKLAREEADGTGGTMRRNAGPIYKIKKADAHKAQQELEALTKKNDALLATTLAAIAKNDSAQASEIGGLGRRRIDGPAKRMEALDRITESSSAIWWANWFIILLFIAVETAPVFVKLISPHGPYDHLLKIEEHRFEAQRVEELAKTNAAIKERTKDVPAREAAYINDRLDMLLDKS